ncbi:hypothetical protein BD779DRAFT_1559214 [Infundibulicybe gibba]|nr:hypothetical protein BD779DRAFT_1559214 [Infundibulicybe gibba]
MAPALSLQLARVTTSPHLPDAPGVLPTTEALAVRLNHPLNPCPLPPIHLPRHATPAAATSAGVFPPPPTLLGPYRGPADPSLDASSNTNSSSLPIYTLASLLASIRMLWPKCTANNLDYFCTLRESHRRKLVILRYMIAFLGGNPRLKMGIS